MTMRAPFNPQRGANQVLSATGTSASVSINPKSKSVRIVNAGDTNIGHVRIGEGAQTASAADTPLLPGESLVISKADGMDTLAYFSTSGTALHIQTGEGGI